MNAPRSDTKLLLVDRRSGELGETRVRALPHLLGRGDLLVVNDAATFPASLSLATEQGEKVEARLFDVPDEPLTRAVLFGAGDFRLRTEDRPPPPALREGDVLTAGDLQWLVADVSARSPRLVTLAWPGPRAQRYAALYRVGRPVQYSYTPEPLALWDVQTVFATRPFAAEMPSAARPIDHGTWQALTARGVRIAALTHAAGLSATGDPALDAALPLPERYVIPGRTVESIREAHASGGRVIAVGTSVVRALEDSAARHGRPVAGAALASLVLEPMSPLRVIDGLFTGIHVPGESHHRLLGAFVDEATLARAGELALRGAYALHEFGDACLLLADVLSARAAA